MKASNDIKDLIRYVLETEAEAFEEWFTSGQGWEDAAVAKTLGIESLGEDDAENLLQLCFSDKLNGYFWEVLAYNCRRDHVFASAVKAAVEVGIFKKSKTKLPARERKHILAAMKEEQ